MKYLTLIRHAKSSRENPGQTDESRPLNSRGLRDAPAMGEYLHATFLFAPDIIVSSPSARTMATAQFIARAIGYGEWKIEQDGRIYEAPVELLVEVVRGQQDKYAHVCLVGHNPGMEDLTNWLCSERVLEKVVTCAVIMLELDIGSWREADAGRTKLREYVYPALIGVGSEED